jgi:outer membrane receptor protein involved in Fe transport
VAELWSVRASAYQLSLLDPPAQQLDGSYLTQVGERTRGLDLSAERRWADGWQLQWGLGLQRGRDGAGMPLPLSPRWTGKWRISSPQWAGGWRLSAFGIAQSAQRDGDQRLPGYGLVHAQMLWSVHPQAELSLGIQNLGGRRYLESSAGAGTRLIERRGAQWHLSWVWRERP